MRKGSLIRAHKTKHSDNLGDPLVECHKLEKKQGLTFDFSFTIREAPGQWDSSIFLSVTSTEWWDVITENRVCPHPGNASCARRPTVDSTAFLAKAPGEASEGPGYITSFEIHYF